MKQICSRQCVILILLFCYNIGIAYGHDVECDAQDVQCALGKAAEKMPVYPANVSADETMVKLRAALALYDMGYTNIPQDNIYYVSFRKADKPRNQIFKNPITGKQINAMQQEVETQQKILELMPDKIYDQGRDEFAKSEIMQTLGKALDYETYKFSTSHKFYTSYKTYVDNSNNIDEKLVEFFGADIILRNDRNFGLYLSTENIPPMTVITRNSNYELTLNNTQLNQCKTSAGYTPVSAQDVRENPGWFKNLVYRKHIETSSFFSDTTTTTTHYFYSQQVSNIYPVGNQLKQNCPNDVNVYIVLMDECTPQPIEYTTSTQDFTYISTFREGNLAKCPSTLTVIAKIKI